MKQYLLPIFLIVFLMLTAAGCSAAGMERSLDRAGDRIENQLDAVEDNVEDAVRRAVSPAPAAIPEVPVVPEVVSAAPSDANRITPEEAQQIALDHVGLTADQVQRLRVQSEIDDGVPQYDVEFHQGSWEYEFEIQAESGKILSYDRDHWRD